MPRGSRQTCPACGPVISYRGPAYRKLAGADARLGLAAAHLAAIVNAPWYMLWYGLECKGSNNQHHSDASMPRSSYRMVEGIPDTDVGFKDRLSTSQIFDHRPVHPWSSSLWFCRADWHVMGLTHWDSASFALAGSQSCRLLFRHLQSYLHAAGNAATCMTAPPAWQLATNIKAKVFLRDPTRQVVQILDIYLILSWSS